MKARRSIWLAGAGVVVAAVAAYHNTLGVPFLFDDEPSIFFNPTIQHLWPPWEALSPPRGFGFTVSGRPLLNLSLALNFAVSGLDGWSYHAFNLLIHALAGLVLFGLARRTLARPGLAPAFGELALPAAFVIALLWTLHPLQTEAVTYVIQRAESLMGLFYLLTLYAFVRAADSARPRAWLAASVAACVLGMGCKEVMVTAPVVVLLFDRTFVAGSLRDAWRSRRGYYVALTLTWLPLAWLVARTGGDRGGTFNFSPAAWAQFWLTQFEALARYLKLAVWPVPLVFEYGRVDTGNAARVVACALPIVALLAATLWALRRRPFGAAQARPVAGFFGASFFLILAPTSLVPGITQTIVEHRMYLPLAAVIGLTAGAVVASWGRRGLMGLLMLALVAGGLTLARNATYQSALTLWRDTVQKRPGSALAQSNLGTALFRRGENAEALRHYQESLHLDPGSAQVHYNLGLVLEKLGRGEEAVAEFREAVRILPYFSQAQSRLGGLLLKAHHAEEALRHLRVAVGYTPELADAQNHLGLALAESGQPAEALEHYAAAVRADPAYAEAECNWGAALVALKQLAEARRHLERAVQLAPKLADAHFNLGLLAAAKGRPDEAQYAEAVRLDPNHGEARLNLGVALARAGRFADGVPQLQEAVRLRPALAEAHANLGIALAETGRVDEAIASYETALRLRPDYAMAHYNLGNALLQRQRIAEARAHFAEAVRLVPDFAAAREMLDRLNAVSPRQ